jgi:hypothetical protein
MLLGFEIMRSRKDDPHRWGAFTMVAPQGRGPSASRWLARDEVAQRLVWVHRFEHDVDCTDVIERVQARPAVEATARLRGIHTAYCASASKPCPAVVSDFVASMPIEASLASGVWRDQRQALSALRYAARAVEHAVVHSALEVDALGRVFVAFPATAVGSLPQEPSVAAAEFAALARTMSASLARDPAIDAVLERAATGAFRSVLALDEALALAGVPAGGHDLPAFSQATQLDEHPLAAVQLAQRAIDDEDFRQSALAEALTGPLLRWLQRWPIDSNVLALLALLEPARAALRERSVRDRAIDKVVQALLGPLEPTWIPLHPSACTRTIVIAGERLTLCPMLWNELQPVASPAGGEARFCVACARAVTSVRGEDGEPQVLASDVCAFVKKAER